MKEGVWREGWGRNLLALQGSDHQPLSETMQQEMALSTFI